MSKSGGVTLKLACPAGETSCSGTVTLRTLGAVKASAHGKKHVLTLAAGSFTVVGGHVKAVTLRLSAKARALLAHSHVLRAQTTLLGARSRRSDRDDADDRDAPPRRSRRTSR